MTFPRSLTATLLTSTALVALVPHAALAEPSFTDLGSISDNSVVYGISGDGSTVVGAADISSYAPFFWNETDGMVALDPISGNIGDCDGSATAVNFDGSVIVGYSFNGSRFVATRWIGGIAEELVNGFGSESEALGVSGDGSVIVGTREGAFTEAFIWTTDTEQMEALTGVVGESAAYAVSSDGQFVGGTSDVGGTQVAMRWSSGGGLETLGTIGGYVGYSYTYALSADGSVATGFSASSTGNQAFRWVDGEGMTGIGALTGTSTSFGQAISADGSVIAGMNIDGGTYTAFRWTEDDGMESLADILTENDVDITGWQLKDARGISADGTLIAGTGEFGGHERAYLMSPGALITPEELAVSLAPVGISGGQSQSTLTNSTEQSKGSWNSFWDFLLTTITLGMAGNDHDRAAPNLYAANDTGTMSDALPAARSSQGMRSALFATGSVNYGERDGFSSDGLSGTTGAMFAFDNNFAFGVGIVGNRSDQDTHLGGSSRVKMLGGSLLGVYGTEAGLRLSGMAVVSKFDLDTRRNYLNGAAVDQSRGETDGMGYAFAVRAGWAVPLASGMSIQPYAELEWDRTEIDGYTETGGGIPASVSDQKTDQFISRLGGEFQKSFDNGLTTRLRAAWGHRLSGDSSAVTVTALGLGQSIQLANGEDDWAELGASAGYDLTEKLRLSGNVDTRLAGSDNADVTFTMGLVYRLN
tara:strand:- start:89449 stop:91551 length:2103 start_codon:yes stop_codon:yes gene_type:complete